MKWSERRSNWTKQANDARDEGDIDYSRIIHSSSFRRLQGKTQTLGLGDGDFYRTRLTHSLEVAQIASGIGKQLKKNFPDHSAMSVLPTQRMLEAIAATHDLGHPPFGHGGEIALNYCMRNAQGFEGNGQTLRILTALEKFSPNDGANLSREALLGVLKYPVAYDKLANPNILPKMHPDPEVTPLLDRDSAEPPKCYLKTEEAAVEWILSPLSSRDRSLFQSLQTREGKHAKSIYKSFSCSIMDLADEISYGVHDLEDGLALRLIDRAAFRKSVPEQSCASLLDYLNSRYPNEYGNDVYEGWIERLLGDGRERKHQISRIVGSIIPQVEIYTKDDFEEPRLRYNAALPTNVQTFVDALVELVRKEIIRSPNVQQLEFKGQMMVIGVFDALSSAPDRYLPRDVLQGHDKRNEIDRLICDYIAGMTDSYLLRIYERLFSPRIGSVFDKL